MLLFNLSLLICDACYNVYICIFIYFYIMFVDKIAYG